MEQNLFKAICEKNVLRSFKETFPKIITETIKYAQNKENTL